MLCGGIAPIDFAEMSRGSQHAFYGRVRGEGACVVRKDGVEDKTVLG